MKMKMKSRSHRYGIYRPRSRHRQKTTYIDLGPDVDTNIVNIKSVSV